MKGSDRERDNPGREQGRECYFEHAEFEMILRHLSADMKLQKI